MFFPLGVLVSDMSLLADLTLVFLAGLVTALATGLGALPFFLVDEVSDRWTVALWGLASGIMVSASLFGLVEEGLAESGGDPTLLVVGVVAGVGLVLAADRVLKRVDVGDGSATASAVEASGDGRRSDGGTRGVEHGRDHAHDDATAAPHDDHAHEHGASGEHDDHRHGADGDHGDHGHDHHVDPGAIIEGDLRKLVLILGVLTVHSFPEGVAVGVSFAELGLSGGVPILGFTVPLLAVFMTVAISIHNVPEGLAVSIPLKTMGVSRWRMVGAAVFSSLPQPVGAVIAFVFVRWARAFLPFGFGLAAGAMVFLVLTEFIPEALDRGKDLDHGGYPELLAGVALGVVGMLPLLLYG
jgi:ZIP family zinc transporter